LSLDGIGISTASKFLYFIKCKYRKYNCLIFDDKISSIINNKLFLELPLDCIITRSNNQNTYFEYLIKMKEISARLKIKRENPEMFLFIFGNTLKK